MYCPVCGYIILNNAKCPRCGFDVSDKNVFAGNGSDNETEAEYYDFSEDSQDEPFLFSDGFLNQIFGGTFFRTFNGTHDGFFDDSFDPFGGGLKNEAEYLKDIKENLITKKQPEMVIIRDIEEFDEFGRPVKRKKSQ